MTGKEHSLGFILPVRSCEIAWRSAANWECQSASLPLVLQDDSRIQQQLGCRLEADVEAAVGPILLKADKLPLLTLALTSHKSQKSVAFSPQTQRSRRADEKRERCGVPELRHWYFPRTPGGLKTGSLDFSP